jgi:riboflavin synthase
MFTGIVEQLGVVTAMTETGSGRRLVLSGPLLGELGVGASIAVNGVCLTAVSVDADTVTLDIVPETLQRSNLGELDVGGRVNVERPTCRPTAASMATSSRAMSTGWGRWPR